MSFPRRSARLAAKAAAASASVPATPAPENPACPYGCCSIPKENARRLFLKNRGCPVSNDEKTRCCTIVKQYLDDVEVTRGRTAKAVLTTRLACFLIDNPQFMAAHERFYKVIVMKMEELKAEKPIEDAVIDAAFRKAVDDLLFVVKD